MGTYVYTVRKSNVVRALDLREGSPTHGQTLRVARLVYLYKPVLSRSESADRMNSPYWAMESRAYEAWDTWEGRPSLVVLAEAKGLPSGDLYHWTGDGSWWDNYPMPGEKVGVLVAISNAKRGQPQVAIKSVRDEVSV